MTYKYTRKESLCQIAKFITLKNFNRIEKILLAKSTVKHYKNTKPVMPSKKIMDKVAENNPVAFWDKMKQDRPKKIEKLDEVIDLPLSLTASDQILWRKQCEIIDVVNDLLK